MNMNQGFKCVLRFKHDDNTEITLRPDQLNDLFGEGVATLCEGCTFNANEDGEHIVVGHLLPGKNTETVANVLGVSKAYLDEQTIKHPAIKWFLRDTASEDTFLLNDPDVRFGVGQGLFEIDIVFTGVKDDGCTYFKCVGGHNFVDVRGTLKTHHVEAEKTLDAVIDHAVAMMPGGNVRPVSLDLIRKLMRGEIQSPEEFMTAIEEAENDERNKDR